VFGDVVRNNHVYFSRDPIVGSGNTLFGHRELATGPWPDRLRFHVGSLIKKRSGRASKRDYRDSVQADLDFYDAAPEHPDIMLKAVQSLGFGFAALDYATLGDGSFLIWESNPYLFLYGPGDRQAQLSERNTLFRLLGHSWAMADFLERCADAPAG
jgi:hypothetical protein